MWVARLLAHDPMMKRFYDQSLRLAASLRVAEFDAAAVLDGEFNVARKALDQAATARSQRADVRLAILALGLAAIVFFAIVPFFNSPSGDGSVSTPDIAKTGTAPDPTNAQQLRELFASGRELAESLKQRGSKSAAQAIDHEQFAALMDLEVNQVVEPVSDLGSRYGELLSQFDHHLEAENRRILSDGIGAWQFLIHKLPQSAASLAGL